MVILVISQFFLAPVNDSGPAAGDGKLLLEDGTSFLLLEDGASFLLLE